MRSYCVLIVLLFVVGCQSTIDKEQPNVNLENRNKQKQDSIVEEYAVNGAHQYSYLIDMDKWQASLDEGLKQDSTIAYLWQQKAMPYFKARKYEVGMDYIDKAVYYDSRRYLPYRAFIKCIFAKTYRAAISDFEECINRSGDSYEMDHTYTFYIGLSYLQLNEFKQAEIYLQKAINKQIEDFGEAHHLDLFYMGIVNYELHDYARAIAYFDQATDLYVEFTEAYYYKIMSSKKMGVPVSKEVVDKAKKYFELGFTINEANAIYEDYPYQLVKAMVN